MRDRPSSAPHRGLSATGLTVAFVRGPGLAEAEVDFVSAWRSGPCLRILGPKVCDVPRGARWLARSVGVRGDLGLARLNETGVSALEGCGGVWLPDPWLAISRHGARAATRRGIPYVVTVWENLRDHPSVRIPGLRRAAARVVRDARLVHCVSERAAGYVLALHPESASKLIVVHPGVDLDTFTAEPSSRPADSHRFIFVGRLVPEKGLLELLAAFDRLSGINERTELWVAGTGPLAGEVHAAAARLKGLRFPGYVSRQRLPELLRSCHTLVLPSKRRRIGPMTLWEEQFGFVLAEAMASGLDIITTTSGSIPEVVGGIGQAVPDEDLDRALVQAMLACVEGHGRWSERSRAARGRACRRFDARRNAEVLLSAVEAALR